MRRLLLGLMVLALACQTTPPAAPADALARIKLPQGFHIDLYASVPGARSLCLDSANTLWVSTREHAVYALPDPNRDHQPDKVVKVLDGLNCPNGIAVRGNDLYVAETDKIRVYPGLVKNPAPVSAPGRVIHELPSETSHGWRYMRLGPDGLLYVAIGAPLNVGEVSDPYGTLARLHTDGSGFEVIARGIRNTVGFDWQPGTNTLYFTENGRDLLGDEIPPDELNKWTAVGQHFGFPYVFGNNRPDPDFGRFKPSGKTFVEPVARFDAHVAALGMRFYRGKMFPEAYRGNIFVAQHGSWNRSTPLGYRVQQVDGTRVTTFAEGWLQSGRAWGRPVDVQELSDGSLVVSDDSGGKLYRITYR